MWKNKIKSNNDGLLQEVRGANHVLPNTVHHSKPAVLSKEAVPWSLDPPPVLSQPK